MSFCKRVTFSCDKGNVLKQNQSVCQKKIVLLKKVYIQLLPDALKSAISEPGNHLVWTFRCSDNFGKVRTKCFVIPADIARSGKTQGAKTCFCDPENVTCRNLRPFWIVSDVFFLKCAEVTSKVGPGYPTFDLSGYRLFEMMISGVLRAPGIRIIEVMGCFGVDWAIGLPNNRFSLATDGNVLR